MAKQPPAQNPRDASDEAFARDTLANVPKRQDPARAKLERWEAVFRRELEQKISARKQRRAYVGAAAVIVLALVGLAQLIAPQAPTAPTVATVVSDKNGNKLLRDRESSPVARGLEIKVGDALVTGQQGHVSLAYRGTDIRLKRDTSVRFHTAMLELLHGTVYVDSHRHGGADAAVVIATAQASFTHTGTQYLVATQDGEVVAAVREGSIIVNSKADTTGAPITADASNGAQQIRITASGEIERRSILSHGGVWEWVAGAAPAFSKANAKWHDVLLWATRELGLALTYQPGAEALAKGTEAHLPGDQVHVEDVIGLVQQATSLQIRQTGAGWAVGLANVTSNS